MKKLKFRYRLIYFVLNVFFFKNIQITVKGIENIPKNKGFIIAANHEHSWDPVIMAFLMKRNIHFFSIDYVSKKTLSEKKWASNLERFIFGDSISGLFLRWTEQIQVSHVNKSLNKRAFAAAGEYIKKSEIIGIFPEGEPELKKKKIYPGVAILSKRNNCKILPVYLRNNAPSDDIVNLNFTKVEMAIGKTLNFSVSVDSTKKRVMKEVYRLKND